MSMENSTLLMIIQKSHSVAITDSVMKKAQCSEMTKSKNMAEIFAKNKQNIPVPLLPSAPEQPDRVWQISMKKILRGKNNPHCQNHSLHWDCSLPLPEQSSAVSLSWHMAGRTNKALLHTNRPRSYKLPQDTVDTGTEYLSNFQMWLEKLT